MFKKVLAMGMVVAWGALVSAQSAEKTAQPAAEKAVVENQEGPLVQMAILLDHSGSMSGLIDQARQHIWKIVNEFATVRRDGKEPRLEVALYKYGNGSPERLVEFTEDLDKISQELFAIQIQGGSEYCGQVIQAAVDDLKWSEADADLKCIFIAGNEPFTQGPIDYKAACKNAIAKGITVSTIFCGDEREGMNGKWQDGALVADGTFMNIDQNQAVAVIETPQDKKIADLSAKLNTTYIAFGAPEKQQEVTANQTAQDANALKLNSYAVAGRAMAKCSNLYVCPWDLVDACKNGKVKLTELKKEDLPEDLRKLSTEELEKHVADKQKEREKIQEEIKELSTKRADYIAEEQKKLAAANPAANTLDKAIIQSVREQATRKNYTIQSK